MDMQGNEMDELFRSSLDDLEIQPSAQVWAGIAKHMDADKRKRRLVPFFSIAAGVILVLTVGTLFMPKQVKVNKQDQLANRTIKNIPSVKKTTPVRSVIDQQNKIAAKAVIAPAKHLATIKVEKVSRDAEANRVKRPNVQRLEVVRLNKPQAVLTQRGDDLANAVITDNTANEIAAQPVVHDLSLAANKPMPIVSSAPVNSKTPAKRSRIHSVGDLFNVVIAAVDKRKDKVIEFSNTDGDDAVITGINLGIIKVKKEK